MNLPIFEEATSRLDNSNDGILAAHVHFHPNGMDRLDDPIEYFVTRGRDPKGEEVFRSKQSVLCDAYIAGYDLARDMQASNLIEPVEVEGVTFLFEGDDDAVEGYVRRSESLHAELLCDDSALD